MKICEQGCVTMEELLNMRPVTPRTGDVDVYIIIEDRKDLIVSQFAVWDSEKWTLFDSMEEVYLYAKNLK